MNLMFLTGYGLALFSCAIFLRHPENAKARAAWADFMSGGAGMAMRIACIAALLTATWTVPYLTKVAGEGAAQNFLAMAAFPILLRLLAGSTGPGKGPPSAP